MDSLGDEPGDTIELPGDEPGYSRPSSGSRPTPGAPPREACRPRKLLTLAFGKSGSMTSKASKTVFDSITLFLSLSVTKSQV